MFCGGAKRGRGKPRPYTEFGRLSLINEKISELRLVDQAVVDGVEG
jgi:hypothetical protein